MSGNGYHCLLLLLLFYQLKAILFHSVVIFKPNAAVWMRWLVHQSFVQGFQGTILPLMYNNAEDNTDGGQATHRLDDRFPSTKETVV
jgi:hypothetical protein